MSNSFSNAKPNHSSLFHENQFSLVGEKDENGKATEAAPFQSFPKEWPQTMRKSSCQASQMPGFNPFLLMNQQNMGSLPMLGGFNSWMMALLPHLCSQAYALGMTQASLGQSRASQGFQSCQHNPVLQSLLQMQKPCQASNGPQGFQCLPNQEASRRPNQGLGASLDTAFQASNQLSPNRRMADGQPETFGQLDARLGGLLLGKRETRNGQIGEEDSASTDINGYSLPLKNGQGPLKAEDPFSAFSNLSNKSQGHQKSLVAADTLAASPVNIIVRTQHGFKIVQDRIETKDMAFLRNYSRIIGYPLRTTQRNTKLGYFTSICKESNCPVKIIIKKFKLITTPEIEHNH